jgi:RNA polymerase sigma factor (sigma-70 family)
LNIQLTFTEAELVVGLQKHDGKAYEYLYSNYKGALYTVISQFITDTETANDVLQDVFIAAWSNIDKYSKEKGRLFTWLHTLTRNTAINKLRSKEFKTTQKNESLGDYVSNIELKDPLQLNINAIGLRKQVHLLREDYKAVLELSYFNGFTQEEIAKALDIPLGTVKTRLRNALIELRKNFV